MLLVGSSGTGKTLAAEVLADNLSLDLNRIDLNAVVQQVRWPDREKPAACFCRGGAMLLFDEADARLMGRYEAKNNPTPSPPAIKGCRWPGVEPSSGNFKSRAVLNLISAAGGRGSALDRSAT